MADNIGVLDKDANPVVLATTESGGVHTPKHLALQSGTWNINVTGTVPLPTGAATAAKQPAIGTAGTPSADVISVQGVSGGTAFGVMGVNGTAIASTGNAIPVGLYPGGNTHASGNDNVDGSATSGTANKLIVITRPTHFNGTTYDRARGNTTGMAVLPYGLQSSHWAYAGPTGGTIENSNTAVTLIAAAGSGVRNYLCSLDLDHDVLGAVTEIAIRDGAGGTVLWRGRLQTPAVERTPIRFEPPLRGSANTLMEIVTLTAVTGKVYVNAQGYQGV